MTRNFHEETFQAALNVRDALEIERGILLGRLRRAVGRADFEILYQEWETLSERISQVQDAAGAALHAWEQERTRRARLLAA